MAEIITRWRKVTEQLAHKLGRSPHLKEVAKTMKMSVDKVRQINEIASKASSLDAPIGEDGTGQFMDLIEVENISSPTDELTRMFQKERVDGLLELISEREKEILNLRFGLKDGMSHTLGETAKKFNITRERVRQIENAAMKKLKLYLAAQEGISAEKLMDKKIKKTRVSGRKRTKTGKRKKAAKKRTVSKKKPAAAKKIKAKAKVKTKGKAKAKTKAKKTRVRKAKRPKKKTAKAKPRKKKTVKKKKVSKKKTSKAKAPKIKTNKKKTAKKIKRVKTKKKNQKKR